MLRGLFAVGRPIAYLKSIASSLSRIADVLERALVDANTPSTSFRSFKDDPTGEASYGAATDAELYEFHDALRRAQEGGRPLSWEELAEQMHRAQVLAEQTRRADSDE